MRVFTTHPGDWSRVAVLLWRGRTQRDFDDRTLLGLTGIACLPVACVFFCNPREGRCPLFLGYATKSLRHTARSANRLGYPVPTNQLIIANQELRTVGARSSRNSHLARAAN